MELFVEDVDAGIGFYRDRHDFRLAEPDGYHLRITTCQAHHARSERTLG